MATTSADLPGGLSQALSDTVTSIHGLFGAAAASVALADVDAGILRYVASHGAGERRIVGVSVPVSRGIAGWVATSGSPVAVTDVQRDQRFARDVAESTGYVPATILAAPILGDEEPLGVISVLDPTGRERDLDLLGTFGVLLAGTLAQRRPVSGALGEAVAAVTALGSDTEALATALLQALVVHRPQQAPHHRGPR